tara:strand:+ start:193 stop:468 length:276 start_codon:yes stop_codon:yes gene_type:complete
VKLERKITPAFDKERSPWNRNTVYILLFSSDYPISFTCQLKHAKRNSAINLHLVNADLATHVDILMINLQLQQNLLEIQKKMHQQQKIDTR